MSRIHPALGEKKAVETKLGTHSHIKSLTGSVRKGEFFCFLNCNVLIFIIKNLYQ